MKLLFFYVFSRALIVPKNSGTVRTYRPSYHTSPVNDQLPLLIGQLEKQSGRSIARIGGEKKLCEVWWRCYSLQLLSHCVTI